MSRINTFSWHRIQIKTLFTAVNTGNILSRDVEDGSGYTPYVTSSAFNNGVAAHIDASKYDIIAGHCILVGGKTFTLTYQENDFVSHDSHNIVLRLIDDIQSKEIYLFLITAIIAALNNKYEWADAVTKDKLLEDYILLPIVATNTPDWGFMHNYIAQLQEQVSAALDSLEKCSTYSKVRIDIQNFKRFNLYDDKLFTIDSGTKLDKIRMTTKCPSVNFVGRANANNGVTDYIDEIRGLTPYKAGNLTVSLGGEYLGSCFIQEKDFYTSQNVNVLIPKHAMSNNCKQYIATMIFREGRLHYKAFVDELNRHMKTDFSIPLPILDNGEIDWNYMDRYIEKLKNSVISNLTNICRIINDKSIYY